MGDLSENFDREEFACNCGCGMDAADYQLVMVLERLRVHYNSPITVTSGNRCRTYNRKVGGAESSQHLTSKAADIKVYSYEPADVFSLLCAWYPDTFGIGLYDTWVHIDVRKIRKRWDKRSD